MTSFKKLQEAYKKSCGCEEKEIDEEGLKDACWKGYEAIGTKKKNGREVPNCVPVKEESLDEASRAETGELFKSLVDKAHASSESGNHTQAKRHLANAQTARYGILSKHMAKHKASFDKYKELKHSYTNSDDHVREAVDLKDIPFTPDPPKKNPSAKAGKYGLGHSIAKHLARQAMKNLTKGKDTNENFASDAQRKAVWASKNEKGVKEEVEVSEEYHVVANNSYYGDKQEPVKLSSHKTKDEADAALAKHKEASKTEKGNRAKWHKTVDDAGLKKHMKEEVEELDEKSDQAVQNKTMKNNMDASIGAKWKVQHNKTNVDVLNSDGKHKTAQAQNKAIGRALRSEESLDEISKDTLHSYVDKAFQHGNDLHYDLAHSRGNKATDAERQAIKDKISKRNTGVIKAAKKLREEQTVLSFDDFMKEQKSCNYKKEELHPNQKKLDKNKNGKLDAHDFKLLRKEESDLDEDAVSDYRDKKRSEREAEHAKQDPKHSVRYAKNMVDVDKAAKKAGERGIKVDPMNFNWKVRNGVQRGKLPEEVELDEVTSPMQKLKDAHERHMQKALAANKAGDDSATKVHQQYMQKITAKMNKLKQNEEIDLAEMEELCEISKDTLKSYVHKAATDIGFRGMDAGRQAGNPEDKSARTKNFKTMAKRVTGIDKAATKLAKEEVEELDELDKKTLGSYVKKSHDQLVKHTGSVNMKFGRGDKDAVAYSLDKTALRKTANRTKGMDQAISKLTKEETVEEAIGTDHVNKDEKLKRAGAKGLGVMDKLKGIKHGFDAARKGESEDELKLYNKSKSTVKEETDMLTFKELLENISESKIDDLKDKLAAQREKRLNAYDFSKEKDKKSNVTKVKGHSYGAGEEEGEDDDDTQKVSKPAKPEVKRGRGRPAGSKSGARN